MKILTITLLLGLLSSPVYTQNKQAAEDLVREGIELHDKGDYKGAVAKYDKALKEDENNFFAMSEKAFSLFSMGKFAESVKYCEQVLKMYPDEADLKMVYVTYGNSTDGLKNTEKAISIYDEGIKKFPDYYQLYFNKGVSQAGLQMYDDANLTFQKAVMCNPFHASSHNAIARLTDDDQNRIAALLAYCTFLVLEPESGRAKENLESVNRLLNGNVEKTGKQSITISVNSDTFGDTTASGEAMPNNFKMVDMILSLTSALDYDKKFKDDTEVEKFNRKMATVCTSLKEGTDKNSGFFWEYYAPYFIAINNKGYLETFSYIVYASSGESYVSKWLKSHTAETDAFYEWSDKFEWKGE